MFLERSYCADNDKFIVNLIINIILLLPYYFLLILLQTVSYDRLS